MFGEWFNLHTSHTIFVGGLVEFIESELDGFQVAGKFFKLVEWRGEQEAGENEAFELGFDIGGGFDAVQRQVPSEFFMEFTELRQDFAELQVEYFGVGQECIAV